VHITKPIPGDWRMALHVNRITVFDGGSVRKNGPPSTENDHFAKTDSGQTT
jgi:hypothetical protein